LSEMLMQKQFHIRKSRTVTYGGWLICCVLCRSQI